MRPVFRATPLGGPMLYKTYAILSPLDTHYRVARCAEVDCEALARGWQSMIDESTDLGQKQAHYIRRLSRRQFTEHRNEHGITIFTFGPGQQCFGVHHQPLERPARYLVRNGDWRINSRRDGVPVREMNCDDWVDDFANHQQMVADRVERG